ncbi:RING/U-box superfamily protein [Raphanus sativus]|uniref:E3 ubiquitin-protein ligase XBAT35 n=1 Tax=Raphanus sativus TaxID=3726 RepID=A0A6J0NMJ0_RAPSA|nr:putative E3 ubiquitin-protein ligase XBAT35 [Raphanus sativus]XP_018485972.1 putative E3 ubiquitin-protein ligase XBAT35 [Raphanus sativus]KAJ4894538.1 RING/U-box superfamily protein [Raphanus sativus]
MMQMEGGDRLRVTLLDCMETGRSSLPGLTLEAILMADRNGASPQPLPSRNQSNRTLLDVMQREHRHDYSPRDKTAWKSLREKLRLKRNATVWISSNPIPSLNTPVLNRDNNDSHQLGSLLSNSRNEGGQSQPGSAPSGGVTAEGRLQLGAVLAEERALSAREEETPPVTTDMQPARMSLMELLDENEGQMNLVGGGDGEEEDERGAVEETAAAAEISCCVCMVRSKGAAFIPCGHTFCRLCSRELWVQRGNCPLCNTSISEILDLF